MLFAESDSSFVTTMIVILVIVVLGKMVNKGAATITKAVAGEALKNFKK